MTKRSERDECERKLRVDAPKPSPYNPHHLIDDVAMRCNHAYRELTHNPRGYPIDVGKLIDLLDIGLVSEFIDEPEDSFFFASYAEDDGVGLITVNEKHRAFFQEHPVAYKHSIGHEVGHSILEHYGYGSAGTDTPLLFSEAKPTTRTFHKSGWPHYALSKDEIGRLKALTRRTQQVLAKKAAIDVDARQALAAITDKYEPEWMFWQAEYFSLCLFTTRDVMLDELEKPWDLTAWSTMCRLADKFGVLPSMIRTRLRKMGVIEFGDDGRIKLTGKTSQPHLF